MRSRERKIGPIGVRETILFGVPVAGLDADHFTRTVCSLAVQERKARIFYANAHVLNLAHRCPRLGDVLSAGDLVLCDGYGVILVSAMGGCRISHRLSGPDWFDRLAGEAARRGMKLFLLGDEDGVAAEAARVMEASHPGLQVSGTYHGFFRKSGPENGRVVEIINRANPDILIVGMGTPVQEFWIDESSEHLKARVSIAVGGAFRWYSGAEKRAPQWMRDHGLEWLGRFIRHPLRHFQRYVLGIPLFLYRAVKERLAMEKLVFRCGRPLWPGCHEECRFFVADTRVGPRTRSCH